MIQCQNLSAKRMMVRTDKSNIHSKHPTEATVFMFTELCLQV